MQPVRKYAEDVTASMQRSLHIMAPRGGGSEDTLPNTERGLASYIDQLLAQKRSGLAPTFEGRDSCNWSTD